MDAPGDVKCLEIAKQPEDRKIVDLTKNVFARISCSVIFICFNDLMFGFQFV